MRLGTFSALVGIALSCGCASIDKSSNYQESQEEIYVSRHWNPLYRIFDPHYWFFGDVSDSETQ